MITLGIAYFKVSVILNMKKKKKNILIKEIKMGFVL
jgi:hypothetical protein